MLYGLQSFLIRTSNFGAEAENVLQMFLNLPREYKVNYLDNTSDFISPDDFMVWKLFWNSYK